MRIFPRMKLSRIIFSVKSGAKYARAVLIRPARYMYDKVTLMDDKLWQWWTQAGRWLRSGFKSPRLWKRVKVMSTSSPVGISIQLKSSVRRGRGGGHRMLDKMRKLYRRFKPRRSAAPTRASSRKKKLPSIPVILWGVTCLGLTAWLVRAKVTPTVKAIEWSRIGWIALAGSAVIIWVLLTAWARKSNRPEYKRYARGIAEAVLIILLIFLVGPRVMRWMKNRPSRVAATPTKVLGDTATLVIRDGRPVRRLVPGGGTLDAWYDPELVNSRLGWEGTRKFREYSLKEGADSAVIFLCGYKVSPDKADCGRS